MDKVTCNCAIITGAGSGTRLKGDVKKQFRDLAGIPVMIRTLSSFMQAECITNIIITAPEEDIDSLRLMIEEFNCDEKPIKIIPGGAERQDSIFGALQACPADTDYVFIHDAVRPFISPELIAGLYREALDKQAVIPCSRVKHTIKQVLGDQVIRTVDRSDLVQVYTPQVFAFELLREAYLKAYEDELVCTDDASVLEHSGIPVHIVLTGDTNIKITDESDWLIAESLLERNKL